MMSCSDKLKIAPKNQNSSPVGSAHRLRLRAPKAVETLLQIKGFGGGVPINTETAAVNPRVGIWKDRQEVFVLYYGTGWERNDAPGPLIYTIAGYSTNLAIRTGAMFRQRNSCRIQW